MYSRLLRRILARHPDAAERRAFPWFGALLVVLAALLPAALHKRFLTVDGELPWEDAPGHLVLLMRWYEVLFHQRAPPEDPYPPGLYLVGSVCLRVLGAHLPAAEWGVVVYAIALSVAMALLGLRLQGRTAGVLLPLLVCAAPMVTNYSRMFLLDLPATATLAWVAVAAASCDGFRRPLATLGLGVALAATALTKYPFLVWAPALAFAPFALMIRRDPASLLPLAAAAAPLAYVLSQLAERVKGQGQVDLATCEGVLAGAAILGVAVGGWVARRGGRRAQGLLPGLYLGLSALAALALVTPWVALAGAQLGRNVVFNVAEKVRPSPQFNLETAWFDLQLAWPYTAVALALGAALAVLEGVARGLGSSNRVLGVDRSRVPVVVPLLVVAATAACGAWATAITLMPNQRYYLPLYPLAAVAIGVPVARLALTRWALAPLLVAVCAAQLVATADVYDFPSARTFPVRVGSNDGPRYPVGHGYLFVPRDPDARTPRHAVERAFVAMRRAFGAPAACGEIAIRRVGHNEPRGFTSLGVLHGFSECAWAAERQVDPPPRAWMFVGLFEAAVEAHAPVLPDGASWREIYRETLADRSIVSVRMR